MLDICAPIEVEQGRAKTLEEAKETRPIFVRHTAPRNLLRQSLLFSSAEKTAPSHLAIEALKKQYHGSRFFLALETLDKAADNYEQRVKRHSFYEKCGLSDMPYKLKEA